MARLLQFALILTFALAFKKPGMDMSLSDAMKTFAEMEDSHSVVLTDSNYESVLSNSSDPWFIYFFEPRSQQSVLKNPVWIIFGSHAKKQNLTLNLARVDLSTQTALRRKFRISSFPVYLYLEQGYTYNYTGPSEIEDFENVVKDQLHFQYDRQPFTVETKNLTLVEMFRRDFIRHPKEFISGIFLASFVAQLGLCRLCCCKKPLKSEEKEEKNIKKKKKRE